jgi:hypothetical protein
MSSQPQIETRSKITIGLSAKGIKNIQNKYNDFTFVVGSRRYHCPSFIAQFLSPRVCSVHLIDDTTKEFSISVDDKQEIFNDILSLGFGDDVVFDATNKTTILSICCGLGNSELYEKICQGFEEELCVDNVIDRLNDLNNIGKDISREVEFIASHFHELKDSLKSMTSSSMIMAIVNHSSLKIESEDSLYEFIVNGISNNCEFFGLLEFVRFEYLSTSNFIEFFDMMSNSFEYFNESLWRSLRSRLSLPVSISVSSTSRNERYVGIDSSRHRIREFSPSSPLDGIIGYLTTRSCGNVSDRGVVSITSSSVWSSDSTHAAKNAADLSANSLFHSLDEENPWLCYDFKDMIITPSHYSIRSRYNGVPGGNHPKYWIVEGSNDGSSWIELDQRINNSDLNAGNVTKTFPISNSSQIRYIRLRQLGKNHAGHLRLVISSFEIFGRLHE